MPGISSAVRGACTGNYRRGIDYVAGFVQPVLSDGVSINLAGSLSSRLELLTSFGYSNGDSALFDETFPSTRTRAGEFALRPDQSDRLLHRIPLLLLPLRGQHAAA